MLFLRWNEYLAAGGHGEDPGSIYNNDQRWPCRRVVASQPCTSPAFAGPRRRADAVRPRWGGGGIAVSILVGGQHPAAAVATAAAAVSDDGSPLHRQQDGLRVLFHEAHAWDGVSDEPHERTEDVKLGNGGYTLFVFFSNQGGFLGLQTTAYQNRERGAWLWPLVAAVL